MILSNSFATGIYAIEATSGEIYVGMTASSFSERSRQHLKLLKRGSHHCKPLQALYNELGSAGFNFKVVEELDDTEEELLLCEQRWWDVYSTQGCIILNGRPSGKGSVLHNLETIKRIQASALKKSKTAYYKQICEENETLIRKRLEERIERAEIAKELNVPLNAVLRFIRSNKIKVPNLSNYKPLSEEERRLLLEVAEEPQISMRAAEHILHRSRQWISRHCKEENITWIS